MKHTKHIKPLITAAILLLAAISCHFPTPTPSPITVPETEASQSTEVTPTRSEPVPSTPTITQSPSETPTPTEEPPQLVCEDATCVEPGMQLNFLIVTRPIFTSTLKDFINWKTQNGFRVGLVTVDWLAATFEGRHIAEQMKTGLHQIRREHTPAGILYVLLVGDTQVESGNFQISALLNAYDLSLEWNVPTGFYRRSSYDPANDILPGDVYFTEDRDWDPDNTGLNPVPDQELAQGTFDATIYLGRWSVRSPDELPAIINKTMQVIPTQNLLFTSSTEFGESPSCCTGMPPSGYSGTNSYACCYIDFGITYSMLFQSDSPWLDVTFHQVASDDEQGGWDTVRLIETFDGVISTLYHGYYDCIGMAGAGCLTASEFNFQSVFPLMDASSCYIGAFYSGESDTLAEAWVKAPLGPAILTQPGHNHFVFWDNLRKGLPAGEAFWRAGAEYVYWPNPMIFLGDPSLPVLMGP